MRAGDTWSFEGSVLAFWAGGPLGGPCAAGGAMRRACAFGRVAEMCKARWCRCEIAGTSNYSSRLGIELPTTPNHQPSSASPANVDSARLRNRARRLSKEPKIPTWRLSSPWRSGKNWRGGQFALWVISCCAQLAHHSGLTLAASWNMRSVSEFFVCENFDLLPSRKPLEAQQKSSCRCAHWQSSAGRAPGSAVRDVFHATCWSNEPQTTRLHRCPRSINKSCQVFLQAIG